MSLPFIIWLSRRGGVKVEEKLAISEEVCGRMSDRETMLSKMN